MQAVDLGFIVGDDYGFALNLVADDKAWKDLEDEFEIFQASFEPPPPA